ncbi:MAG: hypothetical protein H6731_07845 [Myxococcales bacterium]|nr:MAG: hypothetical protein H6731_07845 [Myxococcales bacterium]
MSFNVLLLSFLSLFFSCVRVWCGDVDQIDHHSIAGVDEIQSNEYELLITHLEGEAKSEEKIEAIQSYINDQQVKNNAFDVQMFFNLAPSADPNYVHINKKGL